jgi:uncharacterized protein YlzI (FlbEa/FlbD family)
MIRVIRTDGMEILLNSSLIEDLGMTPDNTTVVTLGTGEQIYIKNTPADILQKIDAYKFGMAEERREEDRERKKKQEELEREREKEKNKERNKEKEREIEKQKEIEQEPEQESEPDLEQEQEQAENQEA